MDMGEETRQDLGVPALSAERVEKRQHKEKKLKNLVYRKKHLLRKPSTLVKGQKGLPLTL